MGLFNELYKLDKAMADLTKQMKKAADYYGLDWEPLEDNIPEPKLEYLKRRWYEFWHK